MLVESTAALGASAIADAEAQSTEWGSGVAITLTPSAKKVFSDFTAQHTRRRMAMAVDGIVEAQAQVMDRIAGGRVHLSLASADGPARAQEIARALRRAAGR